MKKLCLLYALGAVFLALPGEAETVVNLGLVGVGRVPAETLDSLGNDTLGGMFSSMWLDPATITQSGSTYSATIYALPDRGFGDGAQAYHPRLHRISFFINPYYGPGPAAQDQIVFANNGTMIFSVAGNPFTGFVPDDTNFIAYPKSLPSSLGAGLWCLDPEGLTHLADGTWYVSDEYGPFIYHFDSLGVLLNVLAPPDAYLPKMGAAYPRPINYLSAGNIATEDSGRYNNRGLEGVSITPSGKRLVSVIQSPLVQDGQNRNPSRNTRIIVYDIDPGSATYNQPVAEYIHVLPLSAAEANNRHTPVSEILALTETRYLILQRDARGIGGDPGPFLYKRIVLVDVASASNLIGSGYDLEKDAPGQLSLPRSGLPGGVVAASSRDLVDLINPAQLAKYGLNLNATNQDANTICEKWEGMAVIPLNDPAAPNDFLLLVGNDNDFKAPVVYHNGLPAGTNAVTIDNILLAFRIGEDHIAPSLSGPASLTVPAAANCSMPSIVSRFSATDNSAAPITITQTPVAGAAVSLGVSFPVTINAKDVAGNSASPLTVMVTVIDQTAPALTVPSNIVVNTDPGLCSAVVKYSVSATDGCSTPVISCSPATGAAFPKGVTTVICTATDDAGNRATKGFTVTVEDAEQPVIVGIVTSSETLWPPNGRMVPIELSVTTTDNCDDSVRAEIIGVNSSEPVTGPNDTTSPDWNITGPLTVQLRAERLFSGPGRVYTITVRCTDASGNSSTKAVPVTAPHDQSKTNKGEL
jgi:hypothetical protein